MHPYEVKVKALDSLQILFGSDPKTLIEKGFIDLLTEFLNNETDDELVMACLNSLLLVVIKGLDGLESEFIASQLATNRIPAMISLLAFERADDNIAKMSCAVINEMHKLCT